MGLFSSHCFANHKGGCGKSTLVFHTMAQMAEMHPDENFVLFDCSLIGDSSILCLGGSYQLEACYRQYRFENLPPGKENVSFTALTETCLETHGMVRLSEIEDGGSKGGAGFMGMIGRIATGGREKVIDFEENIIKISDVNQNMPVNCYIAPTHVHITHKDYSEEEIESIVAIIKNTLRKSKKKWRLLCDTDGDLQRTGPYTKIGIALCKYNITPIEVSHNDFSRNYHFWEEVMSLKVENPALYGSTSTNLVIFNKVQAVNQEYLSHRSTKPQKKPVLAAIESMMERARIIGQEYDGILTHSRASEEDFKKKQFGVLRLIGNPVSIGEELGCPIATMDPRIHKGELSGTLNAEALNTARQNIEELVSLLLDDDAVL